MRRATVRALAVCAVLLVPGPRGSSGESPKPLEARPTRSPVLLKPAGPALFPGAVQPPEFLLPRKASTARAAPQRPAGTRPARAVAARVARPRAARAPGGLRQYRVAEGDTLWGIARRFGTTVDAIAAANELSDADFLRPGQVLQVPVARAGVASSRPARYTVRPGDTLWAIALKTGVRVEQLAAANGIQGDHLRVGQRLVIPAPGSRPIPRVAPVRVRSTVAYLWPARGVITSRFGMRWRRHHNGVDIAAPPGTPIYAARAGRVVRAGWYGGYGLVVVLDHGDGMETWYGHASRISVRVGQKVERGQPIARVGCTGACTGPHVHFEVRVRGRPVDPLRYLP